MSGHVISMASAANPAATRTSSAIFLLPFNMRSATVVSDSKERSIRIDELDLRLNFTLKDGNSNALIHTSIDIHEGQKVVVGKANIDNADNALILVLTAKVIE